MSGTITGAALATGGNNNNKVTFEICAPFTNYISKTNNTQVDNGKDIYIVMQMYNSI